MSLRGAIVPVLACVLALVALTGWVATGRAGRPAELSVTDARIFVPANDLATAALFTITNTGAGDDALIAVTSPAADRAMLGQSVEVGPGAHRMDMLDLLPIPAHSTVEMTPSTIDVMVTPPPDIRPGDRVTFTLHFRSAPSLTVRATAVPYGG